MKLKILILPMFIIIELILAIGYIKPNIDDITTKLNEITLEKDTLSRVDSVAANIGTVSQALESRPELTKFIERYYPKSLDEERVVDMFNYLAQQSGTVVTEIDIKKTEKIAAPVESAPATEPGTAAFPMAPETTPEVPESYEVEISVLGGYQNIKDFFIRVYQADRLHTEKKFSIVARKDTLSATKPEEESVSTPQPGLLTGSMIAVFPYVKERRVANALNTPIFQGPNFDFGEADKLITFVKSPLPLLQTEGEGKSNPFE